MNKYEVPYSCGACRKCVLDTRYNRCECGGPFIGYQDVQTGIVRNLDGKVVLIRAHDK